MNTERIFCGGISTALHALYLCQGRHAAETLARDMGLELRQIAELGADAALLALIEQQALEPAPLPINCKTGA